MLQRVPRVLQRNYFFLVELSYRVFLFVIGHSSLVIGNQGWNLVTVLWPQGVVSHARVRCGGKRRVKVFRANRLGGGPPACVRVRYGQVRRRTVF